MSWDPLQREILAALGHVVYVVDGRDEAPAAMPGSAMRESVAAANAPAGGPDPLLRALLRAAGRDPGDVEALALCRGLIPPGGLRDVASRRALWPRLRALRARPSR